MSLNNNPTVAVKPSYKPDLDVYSVKDASSGNSGGSIFRVAGKGGSASSGTAGKGGSVVLQAGKGGDASGSGTGGDGGNIFLRPGALGTSSSGTAGVDGTLVLHIPTVDQITSTDTTITVAQLRKGIVERNPGSAATDTLPTPANLIAGLPNAYVGYTFNVVYANMSSYDITLSDGSDSGVTIKTSSTTVIANSCAYLTFRITSVGSTKSYVVYRG